MSEQQKLKILADAIRLQRAHIDRLDADVAEAVKMREHDPWNWMQKGAKANQERQVRQRQLVVLEQEWRSLGGSESGERSPGQGTYAFTGSNG